MDFYFFYWDPLGGNAESNHRVLCDPEPVWGDRLTLAYGRFKQTTTRFRSRRGGYFLDKIEI